MKTTDARQLVLTVVLTTSSLLVLALNGCTRGPEANINVNSNASANANVNANVAVANSNVANQPISAIAAREPDKYKATLVFSAQTQGGERTIGIPTLSAEVGRSGDDRRLSFKLPDGSDLI